MHTTVAGRMVRERGRGKNKKEECDLSFHGKLLLAIVLCESGFLVLVSFQMPCHARTGCAFLLFKDESHFKARQNFP